MTALGKVDLDAYLARIGYDGPCRATDALLAGLHLAHLGAVPFENIDVVSGKSIALDLDALQSKLVGHRRGGYCFEQNTLFSAVLRELGFEVATLEARVRPPGAKQVLPRTHMVLRVDLDGHAYLADVGFGADGPLLPVELDGEISEQHGDRFRVVDEGALRALQVLRADGWQDLYAFTLEPALPIDFEVANHYTSTHPRSPFRMTLTAQLSLPGERRTLRGRTLTVRRGHAETRRQVADGELLPLLRDGFGIELPAATRLP